MSTLWPLSYVWNGKHLIKRITTSVFPSSCKSVIVLPLIKKPGLDPQVLKTTGQFQIYRFCLNLLRR